MKRRIISYLLILIACIIGGWYFFTGGHGSLTTASSASKQVDDFILHIRVEKVEDGIQVLQSLQYVGEEEIIIGHQTPLVSVSLLHNNHDFTGSRVSKVLNKGNIYPQQAVIFPTPEKEECNLYVNARFKVEGERIMIKYAKKLLFNRVE